GNPDGLHPAIVGVADHLVEGDRPGDGWALSVYHVCASPLSLWERASLPLLPQRERPAKRGSASRVRAARFGRLAAESALTQPSPTAVGEGFAPLPAGEASAC